MERKPREERNPFRRGRFDGELVPMTPCNTEVYMFPDHGVYYVEHIHEETNKVYRVVTDRETCLDMYLDGFKIVDEAYRLPPDATKMIVKIAMNTIDEEWEEISGTE